ncbi:hypothetical protein [Pontibacter russatus]|uniref:hypothetical protein n=1 Tax=Pontibacter russatus TaxID=2694929 RepID=UPI00137A4E70|nr:hypothetical protein [Pontibacter russatus]
MKEQKSPKQYFAIVKFEVTPTAAAKLNMLPFHFSQAGTVTKVSELDSVSVQVLKALDVLTVLTPTAAVKELLIIIHHYDGKNQINWGNTLIMLERRLQHLNYKESFIADFMKQLLLTLAPNHLLSIK